MKQNDHPRLTWIGALIIIVCAGLALSVGAPAEAGSTPSSRSNPEGVLSLSGRLTQNKIYTGGDGTTSLELTLSAGSAVMPRGGDRRPVSMVVVLDRSGSMEGQKIQYARKAVRDLVGGLSDQDRFALISYADTVLRHTELLPATPAHRRRLLSEIDGIPAGGNTNLGAGLDLGMTTLRTAAPSGLGRLILISDGLANQGVTDPAALGNMASAASEHGFSVSTVGVGDDFNEMLMTAIADRGAGSYYYLQNPAAFAGVLQQEFRSTLTAAATGITVSIPLPDGMRLIDAASGYPVQILDNTAVFHPGNLRYGQQRRLFLTLQVPPRKGIRYEIRNIFADYTHQGIRHRTVLSDAFSITCVSHPADAMASIRKEAWEKKVIQEDYGKLKHQVAEDIRTGKAPQALEKIRKYQTEQQAVNAVVGSSQVERNLKTDVLQLETMVRETFQGPADEVGTKQKRAAKALQFESYKERRAK